MRKTSNSAVGAVGFVLLGVSSLLFLWTQISNRHVSLAPRPTYEVSAIFDNTGDLKVGAYVSMAGVEVGRVTGIVLDAVDQKAVVLMRLNTQFSRIPKDSSASIYTQGFLGGKFVSLSSGGSEVFLQNQDRITSTHSALSLETTIGQVFAQYLKSKSAPGTADGGTR